MNKDNDIDSDERGNHLAFSSEERQAIKDLVKARKHVHWIIAALALYSVQEFVKWTFQHFSIK